MQRMARRRVASDRMRTSRKLKDVSRDNGRAPKRGAARLDRRVERVGTVSRSVERRFHLADDLALNLP